MPIHRPERAVRVEEDWLASYPGVGRLSGMGMESPIR
jgi:hypothetical protein